MAPGLVTPEKLARGKLPTDVWWHTIVPTSGREKTGYPTQKPEGILRRIVAASTRPGDWCLDFFAGSGTLGAVAAQLGRRYVLIDSNPAAVEIMRSRLAATRRRARGSGTRRRGAIGAGRARRAPHVRPTAPPAPNVRAFGAMFHVELRQFPHNACSFNLSEQELWNVLAPWVREEQVDFGERKWSPHTAKLTVIEGPHLSVEQLSLGRGWAAAQHEGEDATERVLAIATEAARRPAPEPAELDRAGSAGRPAARSTRSPPAQSSRCSSARTPRACSQRGARWRPVPPGSRRASRSRWPNAGSPSRTPTSADSTLDLALADPWWA